MIGDFVWGKIFNGVEDVVWLFLYEEGMATASSASWKKAGWFAGFGWLYAENSRNWTHLQLSRLALLIVLSLFLSSYIYNQIHSLWVFK